MATTKTIQPTGETINLPEMTDRPDMSVVSTSLGKVVDAVNSDNASLIKTEEALAIISTGNTHGAINAGQYVYVRAHSTLAEGLYLASANVAANGTLSGSNVTAVSGGGLNALNSNIANILSSAIDAPTGITIANNYTKKQLSFVSVIFSATSTEALAVSGWRTIGTIHESGFRPSDNIFGTALDDTNGTALEVRILTNGNVDVYVSTTNNTGCKKVFVDISYII